MFMARPRLVSDQTIITVAYDLLMSHGLRGLTFETLAAHVGLVPAALVRRFKNKQELILQIDRYALERTNVKVVEAIEKTASPIEAIIMQFTTELAFASTLEQFANGQEFLLMDFRNKKLYDNYQVSFEHRHQQVIDLLRQAQAVGELKKEGDMSDLARHLEMIAHGAGHVWAMVQDAPIEEYIRHHVVLALTSHYAIKGVR
jgi:AcrR family transcriptional regulator